LEIESIDLPKQLVENIRRVVEDTKMFEDELDFINQAIIKQISKFRQ